MQDQWLWVAVTVAEVLFVLVLLLLVSWIRTRAAQRRDKKAIKALVAETREAKDTRIAEISAFLSAKFGLTGDALARAVRAIYKGEVQLVQAFARTYLERDAGSAARFRRPVQDGLAPYWELSAGAAAAAATDAAADGAGGSDQAGDDVPEATDSSADEVARLRGENTRLSEELKVTMDTMSRMLNEYSTVFAKDEDIGDVTVMDEDASQAAAAELADQDARAELAQEDAAAEAAKSGEDVTVDAAGDGRVATADDELAGGEDAPEAASIVEEPPVDPDELLAASVSAQPAAAYAASEPPVEEPQPDPDEILAAAGAAAGKGSAEQPEDDVEASPAEPAEEIADTDLSADEDRFAADLDPAMKDLSADEDEGEGDGAAKPKEQAKKEERQRVIDADS